MPKGVQEPKSKFVSFHEGLKYDVPVREESSVKTQIIGEVAMRLIELREIDKTLPFLLMHKLCRVYRIDPFAFWLAVDVLAGDHLLSKSLSERAEEKLESKQALHQRQNRALYALDQAFPEIGESLRAILATRSFAGVENAKKSETKKKEKN